MATTYLTVDDAPTVALPAKLAVLEDRDVPAILFCEGRRLAEHPDAARAAIEAGYHLGNHAYSHTHASDLDVDAFREEVARTEDAIEAVYETAGVERPARLFRFPYGDDGGDRADALQDVLAEFGFVPPDRDRIGDRAFRERHDGDLDWFWTVDVEDWDVEDRAGLAENVAGVSDRVESDAADVVLFHDGGNGPAMFEAVVDLLAERGSTFADPLDLVG